MQAEACFVEHGTTSPGLARHPGHKRNAETRYAGNNFKDLVDGAKSGDGGDVLQN